MTDPQAKLNVQQIMDADLADWRQIFGTIKARFKTGSFEAGLGLVNEIGSLAEVANHHPDVRLSYPDVIVSLSSHDVGGITSRDLALASAISDAAAERGIESDTAGLTQVELGVDTANGQALAPFYAALLGGTVENGEPVDSSGQTPTVWWQEPGDDDTYTLPAQAFEQRWHLDVWVGYDEGEARVASVLEAGGRLVSDQAAPNYWVVEDPDGNRSCICTPVGR